MIISVLRIGHRPDRDKRITTHVALVARAFGADSIMIDTPDKKLEGTVGKVVERFGGDFSIRTGVPRTRTLRSWKGTIVHLTMYGMPLEQALKDIPEGEDLLIVVGSEKVPREVYELSHFNVSVTSQPHSEVSALAIALDRIKKGSELGHGMSGGKVSIVPTRRGKVMVQEDGGRGPEETDPGSIPGVPGPDLCRRILEHVGCGPSVIDHIDQVHSMGMDMIGAGLLVDPGLGERLDIPLVEAGLLLHDIGRARTHSIRHVTIGAYMARDLGLDDRLVAIIHNHVGAGVTKEEASAIGLPAEDHIPSTMEEKIVCHADNLVGNRRRIPLTEAMDELRRKGAEDGAKRMREMHSEIELFLGIDIDALIPEDRS